MGKRRVAGKSTETPSKRTKVEGDRSPAVKGFKRLQLSPSAAGGAAHGRQRLLEPGQAARTATNTSPKVKGGFGELPLTLSQSEGVARSATQCSLTALLQPATASKTAELTKTSATSGSHGKLWVSTAAPEQEADLAVAKKKVDQLLAWLDCPPTVDLYSQVLVLSGPPGCGKSTMIDVVSTGRGCVPQRWTPPVPTSWGEHRYQSAASTGYTSKVTDFEEFTTRAKLGALLLHPSKSGRRGGDSSTATQCSGSVQNAVHALQQGQEAADGATQGEGNAASHAAGEGEQKVASATCTAATVMPLLVVDDVPFAHDAESRERIQLALEALVKHSKRRIVVINSIDTARGGGTDSRSRAAQASLMKAVVNSLLRQGACEISLNPITAAAIKKTLLRVAAHHGYDVEPADADALAKASAGDLRSAITSMQLLLLGCLPEGTGGAGSALGKGKGRGRSKTKRAKTRLARGDGSLQAFAKDESLAMFHSLGKILYNKRETSDSTPSQAGVNAGSNAAAPRPAAQADVEAVLSQSSLEPSTVIPFLHEHYLGFIADDAIDEAAAAMDYFCDAEKLASHWDALDTSIAADAQQQSSLTALAAGSLAARGYMYASVRRAGTEWRSLDGPVLWVVQRAMQANDLQLRHVADKPAAAVQGRVSQTRTWAAESLPQLRKLAMGGDAHVVDLLPDTWTRVWNKQLVVENTHLGGSQQTDAFQSEGRLRHRLNLGPHGNGITAPEASLGVQMDGLSQLDYIPQGDAAASDSDEIEDD